MLHSLEEGDLERMIYSKCLYKININIVHNIINYT